MFRSRSAGFTLLELLVTEIVLAVFTLIVVVLLVHAGDSRERNAQRVECETNARTAFDFIARDLRSAGYGVDATAATPQPAIAYVDSMQVIMAENLQPYPDTTKAGHLWPLAYDPTSLPRPYPLVASQWTPPQRYTTGAELIRYTLDLNDDGKVDASDVATTLGADAAVTPNPDDYVLVREVYGDSTGGAAHNNGGTAQRVALVRKPGAGVPAMFTVYLKGDTQPWNWSNGPVPASRLQDVQRVLVNVTGASSKPDDKHRFATAQVRGMVETTRSIPDWGVTTTSVNGYVFFDANKNNAMDSGETGLAGAAVTCGSYVGYTGALGYFSIRVPNGTYTLRHTPPQGYGTFSKPDSFVVTVAGTSLTRSFADTARTGGWINVHVWSDDNGNGKQESSEANLPGILVTKQAGQVSAATDAAGTVRAFAQVGGWSVTVSVPDTMTATTANPVTGVIANNGDSATVAVGLKLATTGHVTGTVYADNNKSGTREVTDLGIANVWVGVSLDNGLSYTCFATTDASGNYDIVVPANDPPRTNAYKVMAIPPPGYFPTSSTSVAGVWVRARRITSGVDFGMANWSIISISASRVLSLAAADMIENDWGSNTANAHKDVDLLLGSDGTSTDNISVWFNNYSSTPYFSSTPDYTRLAPNSVMCMALDTLDTSNGKRPVVVTGTKSATAGNFFVWWTQASSGNQGYLPSTSSGYDSYRTSDGGDVQAVLTLDCSGSSAPDILVGTKSATAGTGTVEVWQSAGGAQPVFTRQETYPTAGGIAAGGMGEVTSMRLVDWNGDGSRDLVVGTRTLNGGQVLLFGLMGRTNGNRFVLKNSFTLTGEAVTALAVTDIDQDGRADLVVGTQKTTNNTGRLIALHNDSATSAWSWSQTQSVQAPALVASLEAAEMGGNASIKDLVVGFRTTSTANTGGVRIYYLDGQALPDAGVDPSGGTITGWVPAIATGNFNYGVYPSTPAAPYLTDFATAVKTSSTGGQLVVFIR